MKKINDKIVQFARVSTFHPPAKTGNKERGEYTQHNNI